MPHRPAVVIRRRRSSLPIVRARLRAYIGGKQSPTDGCAMNSLIGQFDISDDRIKRIVADTINGADDGELFLEYSESEALMFDNGRLKTANFSTDQGFGLRAVAGEATGFAHSSEL